MLRVGAALESARPWAHKRPSLAAALQGDQARDKRSGGRGGLNSVRTNIRPRPSVAMHSDNNWHLSHWYEMPREDPESPEVYTYTDAMSYAPAR